MTAIALSLWCLPARVAAQTDDYRSVASPFQQEFDYTVNSDLRPSVEVDGVRWLRFAVKTRDGRAIETDKLNPVLVEIDLRGGSENAGLQLIVLFENEQGSPLHRLPCDPEKTGKDRMKEIVQKHKLPGAVLEATRKVYLYLEVIR
jgi:hypothetical protein